MSASRLADLLRLTYIQRWGINRMHRPQSVGEHTFRVLAIALELAEFLDREYGVYYLISDILRWALVHDGPECFTGDIPATVKDAFMNPIQLQTIEEEACPWFFKEYHLPDDRAIVIIKIADALEACLWAMKECADMNTYLMTEDRLNNVIAKAVARYAWHALPSLVVVIKSQPPYPAGVMPQQEHSSPQHGPEPEQGHPACDPELRDPQRPDLPPRQLY